MLMVIFGAGASYDSVPAYPPQQPHEDRPPLANSLFDNRREFAILVEQFDRMTPIVPRLRDLTPGKTLEREMEVLQLEGEEFVERRHQLAAVRFYLHMMLGGCETRWNRVAMGVTNYKSLLDKIRYH